MIEVGRWVYLWGKHYLIKRVDGDRALIVPRHRTNKRPSPFDWVLVAKIEKYGLPSGVEE